MSLKRDGSLNAPLIDKPTEHFIKHDFKNYNQGISDRFLFSLKIILLSIINPTPQPPAGSGGEFLWSSMKTRCRQTGRSHREAGGFKTDLHVCVIGSALLEPESSCSPASFIKSTPTRTLNTRKLGQCLTVTHWDPCLDRTTARTR